MQQHKHKESQMRKRNWKEYNRQLVQRGSLTFLIDPKLLDRKPSGKRKNGRPQEFSDQLIIMLLMMKIHFRLSYRTLEGFAESFFSLHNHEVKIPCYSLICKKAGHLKTVLPKLSSRRPSVVILDASGLKVCGEGEWKVKIHGKEKQRKWTKIHIAIDAKSQEIVAVATTESKIKDGQMTGSLLKQVPGSLELILADGAYDDRESRKEVKKKKAKALIPPPKNARLRGVDEDRDNALRIIRGLGGGKEGKSLWGKLTGYSMRSLVETAFSRMKRLSGERLFSKISDSQEVENILRCLILNKMRKAQG